MNKDRWHEIEQIVDQALSIDTLDERTAFLNERLANDDDLRREVTSLLDSIDASQGLWDDLLASNEMLVADMTHSDELGPAATLNSVPDQIGPYRIKQLLGRGGMGNVYLAERINSDFHQHVALKVLQREVQNEEANRRFIQERKILSTLNHPNIAGLLDGGISEGGRPYFVMEYVNGLPITEYCKKNDCSLHQRLDLFMQACQAVQYAHTNFIVHRDLKPDNLLVTPEGQVKILDFGIAKLLDRELSEDQLMQTKAGNRLLSLSFAAPEQITGEPVTAATDVYALGLLLYELLTGARAFNLKGKKLIDAEQIIRHKDPKKPSGSSERWEKKIKGDLDAIILKALRKKPEDRYESVNLLLEDIKRYNTNVPVCARKGTIRYKSKKFIKRNQVALSAAMLFLFAGLLFTGYHIQQITEEKNVAMQEAEKAQMVTDFMVDIFASANPVQNVIDTLNVYDLLQRGKESINNSEVRPELKIDLLLALGNSYVNIGNYEDAEKLLLNADSLSNRLYSKNSFEVANTSLFLGSYYNTVRDFVGAKSYYEKAKLILDNLSEEHWQKKSYSYSGLGESLMELDKPDSAETLLNSALNIKENNKAQRNDILSSKLKLAKVYRIQERFIEAENLYKEILSELDLQETSDNTILSAILNNLAYLLSIQDRHEEAEPYYRRSLLIHNNIYGNDHPTTLMILSNLATVLILQGKHNETEDILKRKLSLTKQRYGEHWRTSSALEILGVFYFRIKDFKNARAYFKQSNEMYKKALNKYHTWTGISDMYWYLSSKNLTGTDIEPFKETDGYKILDYNRPDFTDYDIIRVEQLLEDALSFSEADLTSETSFLEELLKRKR